MMPKDKISLNTTSIVSVIITTYNDQDIIHDILHTLHKEIRIYANYEIVIVDNGSSDATVEKIRLLQKSIPQLRVLVLSQQYHTEIALSAGLENCIGDYIVMMNIYSDPISIIHPLIEKLHTGTDIVIAKYSTKSMFALRGFNKWLITMVSKVSKKDFLFSINYCSAFDRKALNALLRIKRKKRYLGYINSLIGYHRELFYYDPLTIYKNRIPQLQVFEVLALLFDASISNSFRPLRIVTLVGIAASLINFLFIMYVFVITLVKKNIAEGWITTSLIMGTMFFLLFAILTIIAEYLLRVLDEVRSEPAYFIADEFDSSIFTADKERLNVI